MHLVRGSFVFGDCFVIQSRIESEKLSGISLCEIALIHRVNGHVGSEWQRRE